MKVLGKWALTVIAALMMTICLTFTVHASEIDLTTLSDTELEQLIADAQAELAARRNEGALEHRAAAVRPSPDKYTWYVQDYVGRNAASVGYTSLGGDRLERYGMGTLEFVFVTEDGRFIDIENEDEMKQYVVTGQNIAPDTEFKLAFMTDSQGNEYSSLVDYQSINQVDLTVSRLDGKLAGEPVAFDLVPITPSPDKYTWYIRNYVGKNAASVGYTSLGGERLDEYGKGHISFVFVTDDGAYVDPEDEGSLARYVITGQDVQPNTELKLEFMTDSQGNEYGSLVSSQSFRYVTLYVRKLDPVFYEETVPETTEAGSEADKADNGDNPAAPVVSEKPAADGIVYTYRDIRYVLAEDGSAQVCGCNGQKSMVTIPSEADGHKVKSIGDRAFEGCTWIEEFIIWADLVSIGVDAFKDCTGIEDISIGSSVKIIGESAFEGCTGLESVIMWAQPESIEKSTFRNCTSLEDFSIPSSVKAIGESSFEGCTSLETVLLWGSPTIGDYAFHNCTSLSDISISSGTDRIGAHAFDGCASLETVIIWGSSTEIGEDAFANCPNLDQIIQ